MKGRSLWKRIYLFRRKLLLPNLSFRLLTAFVLLLLFAVLVENNILFPKFNQQHARKVQKIFTQKEHKLSGYMDEMEHCIATSDQDSCFILFQTEKERHLRKEGLFVFVYQNDTLAYWSTNDVTVPHVFSAPDLSKPYVSLHNGRYASFVRGYKDYHIVGFILIKNIYTYENKYLKTSFQKDFNLPANVKIYPEYDPDYYPITDSQGNFMWSLIFDSTCYYKYQFYIPAIAYMLAIFIFFMLLNSVFKRLRNNTTRNLYLPFLALILFYTRYCMQRWHFPSVFYDLEIFNPIYYASGWFSSLGELSLWSLFISFFILELYRYLRFPLFYEHRWKYFAYIGLSLTLAIVGFFSIDLLLHDLILNSSDIFEGPNRALLLNIFSLIGFLVILLFLASFCLLLDKTILLCRQELTFYQFFISYIIVLSVVLIIWMLSGLHVSFISILFLTIVAYFLGWVRLKRNVKLNYSHYIILVFVLSVFVSGLINRYSFVKYEGQKEVLVTNLASQYDPTAEFLLKDISKKIITDTLLTDIAYFQLHGNDDFAVLDYVRRNYFHSSHWNRFRFQCLVCDNLSGLEVKQQIHDNCVDYFQLMILQYGNQLPHSEFYYINRIKLDEASSYLGWFRKEKEGEPPVHIFIELWIIGGDTDELGYPELLLDNRYSKGNNLKGYSYAKYNKNRRSSQSGNYKYNLSGDIFQGGEGDYYTVHADGMEHLVYHQDENNMIVLSSYSPKPSDLLFNFSYIFIFSFLLVSLCLLAFYLPVIKKSFQWNFRNKIQFTMIIIILVSFAIIGFITVFYVNRQYMNKNIDIINEKMQAIHAELMEPIMLQKNLDGQWTKENDFLSEWLISLKNLFFTDINLFDVNGQLIVTSLPDIYDRGLVGRQINPNAFIRLAFRQKASILEYEEIGELHYLSAYEPFVDEDNRIVAFLNLPYFTHQDALTEEISSVIITVANSYMVIILITVIISIIVSNQITQPLIMLQEKFRSIKLGEMNEPIYYKSDDEIGGLVKEYNRAIDELAKSANRLARSERESAWREMAKQIAHEINNPLTPMKLSIQHLKRAYDNKSERFDQYMEKISKSLVEQIDNLSSIATEFSNFAKMPAPHNEKIDVIGIINNVVPLYATGDNKRAFHTDFHGLSQAIIYADKEQMSRVFINLLKNALQAIPKDRQVDVHIDVLKINKIIWIRVKDNGLGIPDDMQEKIFRPNFTTKSSGMGMGLAIVQNIVESADGTINFKTKQGEGTTFIISLPAAES